MSESKVFRCGAIIGQGHGDSAVCGQPNYGTDSWQCRDCSIDERDQLKAENEALRKDVDRLQSATTFVQKLCDSAGTQPSVATGYLHDILSALGSGEQA